jgi:hypothetical protein
MHVALLDAWVFLFRRALVVVLEKHVVGKAVVVHESSL